MDLVKKIDAMAKLKKPPNELTRLVAKLQAQVLPWWISGDPWEVSALVGGAIEFRKQTPVSNYTITVYVA